MNLLDRLKFLAVFAWRSALRHKRRSLLVVSTATVGMTGVLFSMGFSNGMVDSMIRGGVQSGMGHVQIRPAGFEQERKIDEEEEEGGGGKEEVEKDDRAYVRVLYFPGFVEIYELFGFY